MNFDDLVREGRQLARPCLFLKDHGPGPVAAVWYEQERKRVAMEVETTGELLWLTVDSAFIPDFETQPESGQYLSVYTNEEDCATGRIVAGDSLRSVPNHRRTLELFAHAARPLPPIEAVFARGSQRVADWLQPNGWSRDEPWNDNFPDPIAKEYVRLFQKECPLYFDPRSDSAVYAVLGGWHFPYPDDDWLELLDKTLLIWTLKDEEPWVEVWHDALSGFTILQRIT